MRFEQLFASVQSAELLIGNAEKNDVAAQRGVAALQIDHRHELGDADRFHIERSPSPDVSAGAEPGERRLRPLVRRHRHHIDVIEQHERFLVRAGTEARVDRLSRGIGADEFRVDVFLQ